MSENPDQKPDLRLVTSAKGGAPIVAGNPGNSGGKKGRSGRPPDVIRRACAMAFDARVKYLKAVVDGKSGEVVLHNGQPLLVDGKPFVMPAGTSERLKAMDLLGKYGGLLKTEVVRTEGTLADYLKARRDRKRSA